MAPPASEQGSLILRLLRYRLDPGAPGAPGAPEAPEGQKGKGGVRGSTANDEPRLTSSASPEQSPPRATTSLSLVHCAAHHQQPSSHSRPLDVIEPPSAWATSPAGPTTGLLYTSETRIGVCSLMLFDKPFPHLPGRPFSLQLLMLPNSSY